MKRHRSPLSRAGLFLLSVSCVACGAATPRPALPAVETSALGLAPADAYFAARVDFERLRAQPGWELLEAAIAREEPLAAGYLRRIDRIYVAVGGLVDAPLGVVESDAAGEYEPRPAWYELAQVLGGRVPTAVAILDGSAAVELCSALMLTGTAREMQGRRVAVKDGVAITVEADRRCIVTFEPALEALLNQRSRGLSPALSRLVSLGRNGDYGLASAAIALDAPAFEATIAALRAPDGASPESLRWAQVSRRVFEILTEGVSSVEWIARTHPGGYRSEAYLAATDADRGTMWRELTVIYWDIVRSFVDAHLLSDATTESFQTALDGMTIERTEDGFVVAHFISEQMLSRSIEATTHHPFESELSASESGSTESAMVAISGTARETIAAVEPRLEEVDQLDSFERLAIRRELAAAYASVGRFDDARGQLREALGEAEEASDQEQRGYAAAELCEIELEFGDVTRAASVIEEARESCALASCGLAQAQVSSCSARVRAAQGRIDDALSSLDDDAAQTGFFGTNPMELTRVRLLLEAGRPAEAAATAHAFRFGRDTVVNPSGLLALEALALARTTAPLELVKSRIELSRSHRPSDPPARRAEESDVLLARVECIARGEREPTSPDTRESCESALARAIEVHGEGHPQTLRTRLAYARVLSSGRNRAGVDEQLRAVDVAVAGLGPDSDVRRERAAFSTTTAPRAPRRPR